MKFNFNELSLNLDKQKHYAVLELIKEERLEIGSPSESKKASSSALSKRNSGLIIKSLIVALPVSVTAKTSSAVPPINIPLLNQW